MRRKSAIILVGLLVICVLSMLYMASDESEETDITSIDSGHDDDDGSNVNEASDQTKQEQSSNFKLVYKDINVSFFESRRNESFFKIPNENTKVEYYLAFDEIAQPKINCLNDLPKPKNSSGESIVLPLNNCSSLNLFKSQFLGTAFTPNLELISSNEKEITLNPGDFILYKCDQKEVLFDYCPTVPSLNDTMNLSSSVTNMIIISITSLSRSSGHKKLQESLKYLRSTKKSFKDFKFPSIPSVNCSETASILLYGHSLQFLQLIKESSPFEYSYDHSFTFELEKKALWQVYKENGYKTLVLYDKFPKALELLNERSVNADSKIINYWNQIGKSKFGCCEDRKCDKRLEAVFDQAKKFILEEKDESKFVFLHFVIDGETDIKGFDSELKGFLESVTKFVDEKQNLGIFLVSDHGVSDESLKNTVQGYFEKNIPMTFLYSNKKFDDLMKVIDNTEKVFTKFDLYHTLSEIALKSQPTIVKVTPLFESEKVYNLIVDPVLRKDCSDVIELNFTCPEIIYKNATNEIQLSLIKALKKYKPLENCIKDIKEISVFKFDIPKENNELFEIFFELDKNPAKAFAYKASGKFYIESVFLLMDSKISKLISC